MEEEKVEVVKKPYSKEKIGVTVMLVGLTAAIFLAIGYWAGSQSEQLQESDTVEVIDTDQAPPVPVLPGETVDSGKETETDETADWKTYTNDEYGFSFKYPGDWEVRDLTSSNQHISDLLGFFGCNPATTVEDSFYLVQVKSTLSGDEIENILQAISNNSNQELVSNNNISVYDTTAKEIKIRNKTTGETSTQYVIENDSKTYILTGSETNNSQTTKVANQIVKTFQFTK